MKKNRILGVIMTVVLAISLVMSSVVVCFQPSDIAVAGPDDYDWAISGDDLYPVPPGNVGIGTDTPATKLEVQAAAEALLKLVNTLVGPNGWTLSLLSGGSFAITDNTAAADRLVIDSSGNVGIGTDSPSAKLDVEVASGGAATIGAPTNSATGNFAVAMGYNTTASGSCSVAAGNGSIASGEGAIAIGGYYSQLVFPPDNWEDYPVIAEGDYSVAMGEGATAGGDHAVAMGYGTNAYGDHSVAMGWQTHAQSNSVAMGASSNASGFWSTAMGLVPTASGHGATALGAYTTASGERSTAVGASTSAIGWYSTAMGWGATASGLGSTAMGNQTTASGDNSTAMGYGTTASGDYSTAIGREIEAGANYVVAISLNDMNGLTVSQPNTMAILGGNVGIGTVAPSAKLDVEVTSGGAATIGSSLNSTTGDYAVAIGNDVEASGDFSVALGGPYSSTDTALINPNMDTIASGEGAIAMSGGIAESKGSLAMGLDSSVTGYYGIGAVAMGLGATASERGAISMGYQTTASGGMGGVAMGRSTTASGLSGAIAMGEGATASGMSGATALGFSTIASGDYGATAIGTMIEAAGMNSVAVGLDFTQYTVSQANTMAIMGGNVGIGTVTPTEALTVKGNILLVDDDGTTPIVELGKGLDYAEGFDVSNEEEIEPGTVLVIDPDNPGELMVSNASYDTKAAGIAAGANDLGSGVRLGAGEFDYDVALAGRVYCNVDATQEAVEPGDLLTTSNTPGYAMKASDYLQAQGAILGKAMEGLEKGQKGQILVLVTLQ